MRDEQRSIRSERFIRIAYAGKWAPLFLLYIVWLAGCVAGSKPPAYYWGDYEGYLSTTFIENDPEKAYSIISGMIAAGERIGPGQGRIAPGLFAEYGFMLYRRGKPELAVEYFRKEAEAFPESAYLMNKLIMRVKARKSDGEAKAPEAAGPSEPQDSPPDPESDHTPPGPKHD